MNSQVAEPVPQPTDGAAAAECIVIDSFDELLANESRILDRITAIQNAGQLFLIHPFLLLADAGVQLSAAATAEIVAAQPHLASLSTTPYHALKRSRSPQRFQVRVRGLFKRSTR